MVSNAFEKLKNQTDADKAKKFARLRIKFRIDEINDKQDQISNIYNSIKKNCINYENEIKNYHLKITGEINNDTSLSQDLKDILLSDIGEDDYPDKLVLGIADEMLILSFSKTTEINIKTLFSYSTLFSNTKVNNCYIFKEMEKNLKTMTVNQETLSLLNHYNELRLINNCIKHNEYVNDELAKFDGWNIGDKLENLESHYERLKPLIYSFINALANVFLDKLKS